MSSGRTRRRCATSMRNGAVGSRSSRVAIVDLEAALGPAERVMLDSSMMIAFHNQLESAHPLADHVLRRVESDDDALRGYYSVISGVELLVRPLRTGRQEFTYMHSFLTEYPHLTVLPMD